MVSWVIDFLQKMKKQIRLCYYDTSGRLVIIRSLEEIDDLKKHFEIKWPLTQQKEFCYKSFLAVKKIGFNQVCISLANNQIIIGFMVVQFLCCKINTKKHENFWSVFLHANNVGSEKLLKYRVGEIIGFAPLLSRLVTECSNFSTCILMTLTQWVRIFSQGAFIFLFYQKIFQRVSFFCNRCSSLFELLVDSNCINSEVMPITYFFAMTVFWCHMQSKYVLHK